MSVREIPAREWPAFLERLAREHRAWLATVDRGGRVEVREQPLESIAADGGGHRLTLRFRIAAAPGALDGLAPAER